MSTSSSRACLPEVAIGERDEKGVQTMRILGRNMAWPLKRQNGGEG